MNKEARDNPYRLVRSRYAIFEKDGAFGLIALGITPSQNVVSNFDTRPGQQGVKYKAFETPAQAEHWFEEYTIATVTENGWSLAWTGPRNCGILRHYEQR